MREILRGKRVDNGKWVYGNIVFTRSGRAFKLEGSFFTGETHEGNFKCGEIYGTEVIPETVGRYTGLTDKNGVKIFEGDIVSFVDFWNTQHKGIVYWESGNYCIDYSKSDNEEDKVFFRLFTAYICGAKIIGNIHDGGIKI